MFPTLIVSIPNPDGPEWNSEIISFYPNGDDLNTNLDEIRSSDYTSEVFVTEDGLEMFITYSNAA